MKEGKNLKIWGVRSDLAGDAICSLPVLNWLELQYPNSYKYFSILRKISQCAPLFYNHSLIDKIVISDFDEGFGPTDKYYFDQCDIKINTRPQHPFGEQWHNHRNMYEETFLMAGIPLEEYYKLPKEQQLPKLEKWFNINKLERTISIHCCPGYGKDNMRGFGVEYSKNLILKLIKSGYKIIRLGHPNEPTFYFDDYSIVNSNTFFDLREKSFIEQIQITLGTSLFIGNDSGYSLGIAAYNEIPQVNLVCMWNQGHTENPLCLAPKGEKCINLWDKEKCSNIPQEKVLESIKLLI